MLVTWFLLINHTPLPDSRNRENYRRLICYNHAFGTQDADTSEVLSRNKVPLTALKASTQGR